MARAPSDVSVPGAPADTAASPPASAESAAPTDDKDAEIARLRAQLAASRPAPADAMVVEGGGAKTAQYKAETKHGDMTSAQLHEKVRKGEVHLSDHHVLCKDGWYVNPQANAQANG